MYPIYADTYERRVKYSLPGGAQNLELTTDWYKDAARSLDYLATRPDIDNNKLAYLGVSMGSAEGVIASALMQDRLKTVILLDGGFFLETPPRGGDQADFAPRMKRPVLMVNGRYDFTFPLEKAQRPVIFHARHTGERQAPPYSGNTARCNGAASAAEDSCPRLARSLFRTGGRRFDSSSITQTPQCAHRAIARKLVFTHDNHRWTQSIYPVPAACWILLRSFNGR